MKDLTHKEYFEGIFQLRGDYQEVLNWIKDMTEKDGRALITKEKKVKGGVDLYYSSQRYLQALGKKLKQRFIGILKVSMRLHTQSKVTGRLLYRVTVLFRSFPFKKGDLIHYKGEDYELVNAEHKVVLKEAKSGRKIYVPIEALEHARAA